MRRLIVEPKWKRHLERRSEAQAKAARRFADYQRRKRANLARKPRPRTHAFKKTSSLIAPERFSIIGNPDEFVRFLNRIRILGRRHNLFFDLSGTKSLTTDGIAAFLATIHHPHLSNAHISGNIPKDVSLQQILDQSGFYDYVKRRTAATKPVLKLGAIRKRQLSSEVVNKKFDQFIAADLIGFVTSHLRGTPGQHPPSYCVLGEAMLNTVHHASAESDRPESWWASVFCDIARGRACFTFIDQGIGIFKSNQLSFRLKLARNLLFRDHSEILRELMHGNIPSSTKDPGRGNGIPSMYKHCKAGRIGAFTILSNDAIGSAESEDFRPLRTAFDGTLLYWEIAV